MPNFQTIFAIGSLLSLCTFGPTLLPSLPSLANILGISSSQPSDSLPLSTGAQPSRMPTYQAPLIIPAIGRHTATVIFAHGLGDTGHGWSDAIRVIQRKGRLNEVKFILPHAPILPVTANSGMAMPAWFDLTSLGNNKDLSNPAEGEEDEAGILASRKYINSLVENEVERNGIRAGRIVLGGFSQGGALSIFTGVTSPYRLGGVVALSSWLLRRSGIKALIPEGHINKATPILMGHGDRDPLVRYAWAQASQEALKELGCAVSLKTYGGMEHSTCMAELDDVEEFLVSRLMNPAKGDS